MHNSLQLDQALSLKCMKLHYVCLYCVCDWMCSLENCAKILLTNEVGKCDKEEEENELTANTLEYTYIFLKALKIISN